MRKFIQNKLKDQKGLTLIELLAVIVILAIIAAIAIPAIGNIIENSRVGAIKSDALNVMAAAELHYAENDTDLATTGTTTITNPIGILKDGNYIDDAGAFSESGMTVTTVTKANSTTPMRFTGKGKVGNVTITFTSASKDEISALDNSEDSGVEITLISGGTGKALVEGR